MTVIDPMPTPDSEPAGITHFVVALVVEAMPPVNDVMSTVKMSDAPLDGPLQ